MERKTSKIFWGLLAILVAALLICDGLGILAEFTALLGGVSVVQLVTGIFLLSWLFSKLFKGQFAGIFIPLACLFVLFEKNIAHLCSLEDENILNNWLVFGCALLLCIGFKLLLGGRHFHYRFKNSNSARTIGAYTRYVDCANFDEAFVENDLGACTVHFENVDQYDGGGVLHVENNLGTTTVYVPASWHLIVNIDNVFGTVHWPNSGNQNGPTLTITGDNNLGSVIVKHI